MTSELLAVTSIFFGVRSGSSPLSFEHDDSPAKTRRHRVINTEFFIQFFLIMVKQNLSLL
jgi:hypothetical protein